MPHGEDETAELAKTASFDKLRMSARGEPVESGVLRGSFLTVTHRTRLGQA
jgi:hypothetical protein